VHATDDTPRVTAPSSVIAIFGPTGVGKTAVALALAQRLRAAGEKPVAV
jgi:tRNA dimethylallyltransferase